MTSLLIIVGFFAVSATIGLIGAAIAPGGFRANVGQALGVCIGAPLAIGVLGVILGLAGAMVHAILG